MTLVISTCTEELSELEFVKPLTDLLGCKSKHYRSVTKKDIEKADRIVISGTALKDFAYLQGDWSWLKTIDKPVLGICAGWQVMFQAVPTHKMELVDSTNIGPREVEVIVPNKLAEGNFNAYFLHTKNGVGVFDTIAWTTDKQQERCMFKHPTKPLYGCIFHPEVMNEDILLAFSEL